MALKDHLTRFRYGALALVIAVGVFGISSLTAAESETGEPELDKLTAQELDASVNQLLAGDALRLEDLNSAADLVKSCLEAMELNVATFEHSTPGNLRITIGSLDGTEMATLAFGPKFLGFRNRQLYYLATLLPPPKPRKGQYCRRS